jgi:hypothetical protein
MVFFSQFANSNLKGDVLEVGTPEGKFTFALMQIAKKLRRLCIGSGINSRSCLF